MSRTSKNLSNPFSTGNGGGHFEAHIQASFVALMLSGGFAPSLPSWPIKEVKLQGKIDGFETDDLIVTVQNPQTKETRKLLGQVKRSITISKGSKLFREVIQAAWLDFNNRQIFTPKKDVIALITGPISAKDERTVKWLLDQAKKTKNVEEFNRNIEQANFSPSQSSEKLEAFKFHLNKANRDEEVSDEDVFEFLRHFQLLGYDLGNEQGVVLSLLHSHISQFQKDHSPWVWSRIVDVVQSWNHAAGTITPDRLPEDLVDAFKPRKIAEIPEEFSTSYNEVEAQDWNKHPEANLLALATLIGSWTDNNESDKRVLSSLLGIEYEEWLKKAKEILQLSNSPLILKNGTWKVNNRFELLKVLGSRILDENIDEFEAQAIAVLQEKDPSFELAPEKRYTSRIQGKTLEFSHEIRKGVSEGMALLSVLQEHLTNCSFGKAEGMCNNVIRQILFNSDWVLWGSLDNLLPTISESAPSVFLEGVENALRPKDSVFDMLYNQEGGGISGRTYISGLLWALEGLAWSEDYLVRVCLILAELAQRDPGGKWSNRPSNSLITILLPWFPQTLATVEKRIVAIRTILEEWPDVGFKLLIQLLPGNHQTTTGSHKPSLLFNLPDNDSLKVSNEEYWRQVSTYSEIAVIEAGADASRLKIIIDHFDQLPEPAFSNLIKTLSSEKMTSLQENQKSELWNSINHLVKRHRRFSDAKWALPEKQLSRIEEVALKLAPTDPISLFQHLFTNRDYDLYEKNGNWEEQARKLGELRVNAINRIIQDYGFEGIIRFASIVQSPYQVGFALAGVAQKELADYLLPEYLKSEDAQLKSFISGFIWRKFVLAGWQWIDEINNSEWSKGDKIEFLINLPFTNEVWEKATQWLGNAVNEYWTRTSANAYQANGDISYAVEKLIEVNRPFAALGCLRKNIHANEGIDNEQAVKALLLAISSNEPIHGVDAYDVLDIIKVLQEDISVTQDDLLKIEWAYLDLLDRNEEAAPIHLERQLAENPEFFAEVIRMIYRSKKKSQESKVKNTHTQEVALNAWRLLHEWKTVPGTTSKDNFNPDKFEIWLNEVEKICHDSGHLEVALSTIGEVLVHAPKDPDGFWINRTIAKALNKKDHEEMRKGFKIRVFNSRGVHFVDPTGKPESELAEHYQIKAEASENAGFHRLAVSLRELAKDYENQAKQIIANNGNDFN